jgi:hypothetical protein
LTPSINPALDWSSFLDSFFVLREWEPPQNMAALKGFNVLTNQSKEISMRKNLLTIVLLALLAVALGVSMSAGAQQAQPQTTVKPYHSGPVWDIAFIRVKPGMDDRYMRYLADEWKREQEGLKNAGYILDYKVIQTESHSPQDYNVLLMTQFKDLATLEANEDKMEELAQQMFGGMPKIESGYQDRASYREIMGDRLGREIILEPKPASSK